MSNINSPIDVYEQSRVATAQQEGFAMFNVAPDGDVPGFVYTIGMSQHLLPEVLAFYPEGEEQSAPGVVGTFANRLMTGLSRFDRIALLRAVINRTITIADTQYSVEYLRGDDFSHAIRAYLTRTTRFRETLGMPRGVLVLNREDVPSFRMIRAQRMMSVS